MQGEAEQGGGRRAREPHLFVFLFSSLQRGEEQVELSTIEELVEDAIVSTQPAMMVNLRACSAPGGLVSGHSKQIICRHTVSRVLCQILILSTSSLSYTVRRHPWCTRPSQPPPDLPSYSYGSFEHHTWEASWKVRARNGWGTARLWLQVFPALLLRVWPLFSSMASHL